VKRGFLSCRILEGTMKLARVIRRNSIQMSYISAAGCNDLLDVRGFDESADGFYAWTYELSEDGWPYYKQIGKNNSL
jgi:hypothetical protein